MTMNFARARVIEALKNIEDTPLGKTFAHWVTQDLHRTMEDILEFEIKMDSSPYIQMSAKFLTGDTYATLMQYNQVLAFGIPDQDEEQDE